MDKLHCGKERQYLVWPETYSGVPNLIHGIALKEDFNGEIFWLFLSLFCLNSFFSFKQHFSSYSISRQVQEAHEEHLEHHWDSDGGWVQDKIWLCLYVEFWWLNCVFIDYAVCKGCCYLSQSNSPPFFQFGNMSNKLLGNDEETQPNLFIWVSTNNKM